MEENRLKKWAVEALFVSDWPTDAIGVHLTRTEYHQSNKTKLLIGGLENKPLIIQISGWLIEGDQLND